MAASLEESVHNHRDRRICERTAIAGSGLVGDGLVFTDLNEGKNRLEVAVDSEDAVSDAKTAVSESGVP